MTPAKLHAALRGRGFTLTAAGGRLVVRPASALTDSDRAAIRAALPGLLAALGTGPGPAADLWDWPTAVGLLTAADTLAERLGVAGTRPAVAAAADAAYRAYARHDLAAVRAAVAEFERVVRSHAAGDPACRGRAGQTPAA
jgi:hypothetical protein